MCRTCTHLKKKKHVILGVRRGEEKEEGNEDVNFFKKKAFGMKIKINEHSTGVWVREYGRG